MFVVLTVVILGKADTSFTDGFSGADQIGAFIGMVAIVASFVLAWSLYASDYSRYLPSNTSTSKVFWYTLAGMAIASGWLEILGVMVATNRRLPAASRATRSSPSWAGAARSSPASPWSPSSSGRSPSTR